MKVEWNKFSEQEPEKGDWIWVVNYKGEVLLTTVDLWGCDDTHWAHAERPAPPEQEKKWRLKSGVKILGQTALASTFDKKLELIGESGDSYLMREDMFNDIFEEVPE